MKAIRLKIHQETANYRLPFDYDLRESLPLPPYSTVIGMIHNLCGYTNYHPMQLSIQGTYDSTTSNLQTRYEFGVIDKRALSIQIISQNNGEKQVQRIIRGIMHVQLLNNVNLLIHVVPSNQDFATIYNALKKPKNYPSLGRYEDLASMQVDTTDLKEKQLNEDMSIQNGFYVPINKVNELRLQGVYYNLPKQYEHLTAKNYSIREWIEKVPTYYVSSLTVNAGQTLMQDDNNNVVFLG